MISWERHVCCSFRRCCVGHDTKRGLRMIQLVEKGDGLLGVGWEAGSVASILSLRTDIVMSVVLALVR